MMRIFTIYINRVIVSMKSIRYAGIVKKMTILGMLVLGSATFLVIPAYAIDGWQKNDASQWIYYEEEKQVKNKWVQDAQGHWLYVNGSGIMVSNTSVNVKGIYYFFDKNGFMCTNGWCAAENVNASNGKVSYTWFYADEEGKLYCDGWYSIDGVQFYFEKNGRAVRGGVVTVGEQKYYVDKDKGCQGIGGGWFSVEAERTLPTDQVRTTWYYANADGSLYYDGWKDVDGGSYYFTKGGAVTRSGIVKVDDRWYYVDKEKGCLGIGGGWFSVDT
ncbi:MAG: hypothetical protein PHY47_19435, partial [Lachnospiraceae bacterium]|nr:hypothetical protein [Lachnospiraceae bacterium]